MSYSLGDPIAAAEEELLMAMLTGDRATFDRLMKNAMVVMVKTDTVTNIMADATLFAKGRVRFSKLEPSEQQMTRHPTSAVVSGRLDVAGESNGKPFRGAVRYIRAWHKRPRGWRVASVHLSPVDE